MRFFNGLTIERASDGGFVVWDAGSRHNPPIGGAPLFACGSIGEATAFVLTKMQGVEAKANGMMLNAAGLRHPTPETLGVARCL
jgi:hypothetical protein